MPKDIPTDRSPDQAAFGRKPLTSHNINAIITTLASFMNAPPFLPFLGLRMYLRFSILSITRVQNPFLSSRLSVTIRSDLNLIF